MKRLLIGTNNEGKLGEFKKFLSALPVEIVFPSDIGLKLSPPEDADTYIENSEVKAKHFAKKSGLPTIADDGGIEIDFLNGAPGIRSRRYFGTNGKEATDKEIIDEMLKIAKKMPDDKRGARFVDIVSLALPDGRVWSVYAEVKGIVPQKPLLKILKGYPYRSFFYLPQIKKYYHEADLTEEEEKEYNHRYIAVRKLLPIISKVLGIK